MRPVQEQLAELEAAEALIAHAPGQACAIIAEALFAENVLVSTRAEDSLVRIAESSGEAALPAIQAAFEDTEEHAHGPAASGAEALRKLAHREDYFGLAEELVANWLRRVHTYAGECLYDGEEPGMISEVISGGPFILAESEVARKAIYAPLQDKTQTSPDEVAGMADRFLKSENSFMRRAFLSILPELAALPEHKGAAVDVWSRAVSRDRNSVRWAADGLMAAMLDAAPDEMLSWVDDQIAEGEGQHDQFIAHALLKNLADTQLTNRLQRLVRGTRDRHAIAQIAQWISANAGEASGACELLTALWDRIRELVSDESFSFDRYEYMDALEACAPRCPEEVIELLRDALLVLGERVEAEVGRAVLALPESHEQDGLGLLRGLAQSESVAVRSTVADVLGDAQLDIGSTLELLARLAEDPSPSADFDPFGYQTPRPSDDDYSGVVMSPRTVRENVALATAELIQRTPDSAEAWRLLQQLSCDTHWIVRYWVAFICVNLVAVDAERVHDIIDAMTDRESHPRVLYRIASLWGQLAGHYPDDADEHLSQIVMSGNAGIRVGLAPLVTHGGLISEPLRPVLENLLEDPNPDVRRRIAWRLTRLIRDPQGVDVQEALCLLRRLAGDEDEEVRSTVRLALHDASPDRIDDLGPIIDAYLGATTSFDISQSSGGAAYTLGTFFADAAEGHPERVLSWIKTMHDGPGLSPVPTVGDALASIYATADDPDMKAGAFAILESMADRFGGTFERLLSDLR